MDCSSGYHFNECDYIRNSTWRSGKYDNDSIFYHWCYAYRAWYYMPKLKQNYTIGIRVLCTLNNEENWNMTHRMAGKVYVVAGVI